MINEDSELFSLACILHGEINMEQKVRTDSVVSLLCNETIAARPSNKGAELWHFLHLLSRIVRLHPLVGIASGSVKQVLASGLFRRF